MVKIRKGTRILSVPKSAFAEFYRSAGWEEIKPVVSNWEKEVKGMSNADLKKVAQDKGIKTAGVSKKALIETLIKEG